MRVIICGGRDYILNSFDYYELDKLHEKLKFTEVVSGGCAGADKGGESWATANKIPITRFVPDWVKSGKAAGPLRNEEMAEYSDICVAFPGGAGTKDMITRAEAWQLKIYKLREDVKNG